MAAGQGVHSGVVELNTDVVGACLVGGEGESLGGSSVAQHFEVVVDVRVIVEPDPEASVSFNEIDVFHEDDSVCGAVHVGDLALG
jgi:hypothetical protein